MEPTPTKVVLRSIVMDSGEQSVMIVLGQLMLMLPVDSWVIQTILVIIILQSSKLCLSLSVTINTALKIKRPVCICF